MKTIIPLDNIFDDSEDGPMIPNDLDSELSKEVAKLLEDSKEEDKGKEYKDGQG